MSAYYLGVDLGKLQDPTAAVLLEPLMHQVWQDREVETFLDRYEVRHIQRWALGTSYPRIIAETETILDRPEIVEQCTLVVDVTGVGTAVADMFDEAGLPYVGVSITGGDGWRREGASRYYVSKHFPVSLVMKFLSSQMIGVNLELPHASTLKVV